MIAEPSVTNPTGFVAINTIHCRADYCDRFECLFCTRAHAIDDAPGFQHMYVLKPSAEGEPYLVVSHWESEESFKSWVGSPAFHSGHSRAFADLQAAKERGEDPPMTSQFRTYAILTR